MRCKTRGHLDDSKPQVSTKNPVAPGARAPFKAQPIQHIQLLNRVRKGDAGLYAYEMIQLSDCGKYRHRVWHWYRAGRLVSRTLSDEQRASHNWRGFGGHTVAGDDIPA